MLGITYVYIDAVFCFYGYFFKIHPYCLDGCLSMIVWTHAVFGVLYTRVLYFLYLHLLSATEHVSLEKRTRNTFIIIIIIIILLFLTFSSGRASLHDNRLRPGLIALLYSLQHIDNSMLYAATLNGNRQTLESLFKQMGFFSFQGDHAKLISFGGE